MEGVNVMERFQDIVKVERKQAIASSAQGLVQSWTMVAVFCSHHCTPNNRVQVQQTCL